MSRDAAHKLYTLKTNGDTRKYEHPRAHREDAFDLVGNRFCRQRKINRNKTTVKTSCLVHSNASRLSRETNHRRHRVTEEQHEESQV